MNEIYIIQAFGNSNECLNKQYVSNLEKLLIEASLLLYSGAWNNALTDTWGLPPLEKLESRHITFTVLVRPKVIHVEEY